MITSVLKILRHKLSLKIPFLKVYEIPMRLKSEYCTVRYIRIMPVEPHTLRLVASCKKCTQGNSERSVRRYCSENVGMTRRSQTTDEEVFEQVQQAVVEVSPS